MTLRAWIITLRGRIRETLVPELQELRDRLAKEVAATNNMRPLVDDYIATISVRGLQQQLILSQKDTIARLEADARRGRFLLDKMWHQDSPQHLPPYAGWALTGIYPGDDPAAAVDAAMSDRALMQQALELLSDAQQHYCSLTDSEAEALRTELATLRARHYETRSLLATAEAECDALRAENERWRYWRTLWCSDDDDITEPYMHALDETDFDAAIDEARAALKEAQR